jgi:hypothetical protein
MPTSYFKLVAVDDPSWLQSEFLNGRARFGWSGPGTDLRIIAAIPWEVRTTDQHVTWSKTQFLLNRVAPGDRVVYQFQRPLRAFLIGEVIEPGYDVDVTGRGDFNHFLCVKPLVDEPISVSSIGVPGFLRHGLSKRGQYYQVYAQECVDALDRLVSEPVAQGERDVGVDLSETRAAIEVAVVEHIRSRWPAKSFEPFTAWLLEQVPGVEVIDVRDVQKGWDLRIRIFDPLSGSTLFDNVPVQCKNHSGSVSEDKPINDLRRAVRASGSPLAYLVILGDLDDGYRRRIAEAAAEMSIELGTPITFVVLDEKRVAELYVTALSQRPHLSTRL